MPDNINFAQYFVGAIDERLNQSAFKRHVLKGGNHAGLSEEKETIIKALREKLLEIQENDLPQPEKLIQIFAAVEQAQKELMYQRWRYQTKIEATEFEGGDDHYTQKVLPEGDTEKFLNKALDKLLKDIKSDEVLYNTAFVLKNSMRKELSETDGYQADLEQRAVQNGYSDGMNRYSNNAPFGEKDAKHEFRTVKKLKEIEVTDKATRNTTQLADWIKNHTTAPAVEQKTTPANNQVTQEKTAPRLYVLEGSKFRLQIKQQLKNLKESTVSVNLQKVVRNVGDAIGKHFKSLLNRDSAKTQEKFFHPPAQNAGIEMDQINNNQPNRSAGKVIS